MNYLKERIGQVMNKLMYRICTDSEKIENLEVCTTGYKGLSNTPPRRRRMEALQLGRHLRRHARMARLVPYHR